MKIHSHVGISGETSVEAYQVIKCFSVSSRFCFVVAFLYFLRAVFVSKVFLFTQYLSALHIFPTMYL